MKNLQSGYYGVYVYAENHLGQSTCSVLHFTVADKLTPLGDADGDGDVSSIDVTYILRYIAQMDVDIDEAVLMNADVDANGDLEVIDATYIQRRIAEFAVPYAIGERITA